jgi:hypothetical protein
LYQDYTGGDPSVKFVKLSVLDNPYIPEEEKQNLKDKWAGHPEENARLYGTLFNVLVWFIRCGNQLPTVYPGMKYRVPGVEFV